MNGNRLQNHEFLTRLVYTHTPGPGEGNGQLDYSIGCVMKFDRQPAVALTGHFSHGGYTDTLSI